MPDEQPQPRQPTHIIWQVIGEAAYARWVRIGHAFRNRDGEGLACHFDAYPVRGRVVIREVAEAPRESGGRG